MNIVSGSSLVRVRNAGPQDIEAINAIISASTIEDAKEHGNFDDSFIYAQFAAPRNELFLWQRRGDGRRRFHPSLRVEVDADLVDADVGLRLVNRSNAHGQPVGRDSTLEAAEQQRVVIGIEIERG